MPQLQRIKADCPLLEDLSVRVNRNGTWPYDVLNTLATFENVRTLQLWLELGVDQHQGEEPYYELSSYGTTGDDAYRQPGVNSSSALGLFHHLRAQKGGVELLQLVLYVGDYGRDYGGGGLRFPSWGEGLEDKCVCDVQNNEGERKLEGEAWCGLEW